MVSPRKRVAMISITQPVKDTPKQLVASGSPAKEQDWEVGETMFLCVAFAFIKACALLSAAYLTCAEEDLHLYGLLLQHTRAYKSHQGLQVLTYGDRVDIYLSIFYEIYCFVLLCHQHRSAQSCRTVYIVPSLFAGHLPWWICLCQLVITSKNHWMTPAVNSPCTYSVSNLWSHNVVHKVSSHLTPHNTSWTSC